MHVTSEDKAHTEPSDDGPAPEGHTSNGVIFATVILCCFLAENNLPFSLADQLVDVHKRMFPDYLIAHIKSPYEEQTAPRSSDP